MPIVQHPHVNVTYRYTLACACTHMIYGKVCTMHMFVNVLTAEHEDIGKIIFAPAEMEPDPQLGSLHQNVTELTSASFRRISKRGTSG